MYRSRDGARRRGGTDEAFVIGFICLVFIVMIGAGAAYFAPLTGGPPRFDEARLDAEEAGFNREMSVWIQVAEKNAKIIYNAINDYKKYVNIFEKTESEKSINNAHSAIIELKAIAKEKLARFERTLPPPSMATIHAQSTILLAGCASDAYSGRPNQVLDFERNCLELLNATRLFRERVASRPAATSTQTPINIVFRPLNGPIEIGIDTNSKILFSFSTEVSVSTPAGDFSLSQANPSGVKKMIIRSNMKERYFSLEQKPFNVFIPTDYGVSVSSDGDVLIIDVVSRKNN
jgi:hypothetical protein